MPQNILITGAAGYIGGTVLAHILHQPSDGPFKSVKVTATVRTAKQAEAVSKLPVDVVQLDLGHAAAVADVVLSREIDVVVHTASMIDVPYVTNLLNALGRRRQATEQDLAFINSAATSMFSVEGGWPYGQARDSDNLYEREKELGADNFVRAGNTTAIELGKKYGVRTFIVPLPPIYGRGLGEVKKLSMPIPSQVRAATKDKIVHKFAKEGNPPTVHVDDLATLYTLIVEKVLLKEPIPSGEHGYYFPMSHRWPWWTVHELIAKSLHARGLVTDPTVRVWSDWDTAANALANPRAYIEPIMMSTGDLVAVNAFQIGWKPQWDQQRFLAGIDDEVQDAIDLDRFEMTGYGFLMDHKVSL